MKKLYEYVKADLDSNYVCLGWFYQNPYKDRQNILLHLRASSSREDRTCRAGRQQRSWYVHREPHRQFQLCPYGP